MRRIVFDTDVASLSIKRRLPPEMLREILGARVAIYFVTFGELTRWTVIRKWSSARRAELSAWLTTRPALPYSDDVARCWGEISARADLPGRPRPQNDTWIAACCLTDDLPLATLNVKDFRDFVEHEGLRLIG